MSQPVQAPCPHCGELVRIRVQGEKIVWTPAGCPSCQHVYHGTEKWDLTAAVPAGERW